MEASRWAYLIAGWGAMPVTMNFRDLGLGNSAMVRDLWAKKDLGNIPREVQRDCSAAWSRLDPGKARHLIYGRHRIQKRGKDWADLGTRALCVGHFVRCFRLGFSDSAWAIEGHNVLLPQPQQIRYGAHRVRIRGLGIRLTAEPTIEDRFAAGQLSNAFPMLQRTSSRFPG